MAVAGGPVLNTPPVAASPDQKPTIPFRQATIERSDILVNESLTAPTVSTRFERTVEGSGYLFSVLLNFVNTTSGNAAATAYFEDAPWSALDACVFRDVNGELVNLTGYNLYISNLVDHIYAVTHPDSATLGTGTAFVATNTNLFNLVSGGGGTGGSYGFWLRIPVVNNRRDLVGLVGNQDRAQKYLVRTDVANHSAAATGPVYTTAPTAQGSLKVNKYYESYSVPLPTAPTGQKQQSFPDTFGTLHFTTASLSDSAPVGGSTVNHYIRRLGNTVRWMGLVFRSNGTRANADTNQPTTIQLKIGDDVVFNEDYNFRRERMYEHYGFEFPKGVVIYDWVHDLDKGAGWEMGFDYVHTQAIVNAQFLINYPAGFGSTNNTLQIISDDLQVGAFGRK